ncbi:hypothetical protein I4U23_007395 [Adineta vaga]|nr:hypothetical protein I4U23_007395 [Adineta vaga]
MATEKNDEICSECDVYARWYCVQDDANFCDEHNTIAHTLKSQKLHKIVSINKKHTTIEDNDDSIKPMNCKSHHMPLCLYCLSCQEVCCVACLSVDIHKQHSDQVKSVVDVANKEKGFLNEHLERIRKLSIAFEDEQEQLEQALRNIEMSETEGDEKIDREFEQILVYVQERRKTLKKQLFKKSKIYRENIYSRQEDLKNIHSSLKRCLEESQRILSLNDFIALTHSKNTIEKIKILEKEGVEYCNQIQLSNSLLFHISIQPIMEMIDTAGSIGLPPTPKFIQEKCKKYLHHLDIEWESIESDPPVTDYVLELGQNDNNFKEVYRGLDTLYHIHDLQSNTLYSLRLYATCRGKMQHPAVLEMRTLKPDLNNWTLSMSSTYARLNAENTRESLLDEQLTTGAATDTGSVWIKASFPYPVLVNSVTIAPLHKNDRVWLPTNGDSGSLQYSYDNIDWKTVGTIAYVPMEKQKFVVNGIEAQYWRLFHNGYLGTSCFVFK